MKKINVTKKFITEHISPIGDYSPNYNNILNKVLRIENGREVCEYLKREGKKYCIEGVERFDVLKAIRFDKVSRTGEEKYYVVLGITPTELFIDAGHKTYKECIRVLDDIKAAEDVEEGTFSVFGEEEKPTQEVPDTNTEENETDVKIDAEPVGNPNTEDNEILDNFFKGFTFSEYDLFCKCLIPLLIGRDIEKKPLDFNKHKDYGRLCKHIIRHINVYPEGHWQIDDWYAFMMKIREMNENKLKAVCEAIKDGEVFKAYERQTVQKYWQKYPDSPFNPNIQPEGGVVVDTDEALRYIV